MDTQQINSILFNDRFTKKYFIGTFPCDVLPDKVPPVFALVVNTDKSTGSGLHWQSIFGRNGSIFFFDSYGQKPEGDVLEFCSRFPRVYYNAMSHQRLDEITCGIYAIHHIYLQSRGKSFKSIVDIFVRTEEDDKYLRAWISRHFVINS